MKKIKYFAIILLSFLIMPVMVNAASGKIAVSGTSTVVVGNKVTVTVTLSSATSIGSWQMSLNYDKSILQLTSTNSEAGGVRMANSSAGGTKKVTYTFTFKTLKTGTTKVSVDSFLAYAFDDLSQMSLTSGSKQIKIITQQELEASYSKDNNLSSLSVEGFEISPEFNKDTLEYNVVVPEDTKEIKINAAVSDNKSSINGIGVKEVTSGTNTFPVVVRAQNGAEKTYTITVEVKDANPINVELDGKKYTVVKIKENLPLIDNYEESMVRINEFDIPAYKSNQTKITLVGLKNEAGEIALFIYDDNKNKYSSYEEIGVNKTKVFPVATNEVIEGYEKGKVKINNTEIDCFYLDKKSRFVIIYGINIETGEKGFFTYDKNTQTAIKYQDDYSPLLKEQIKEYKYIILGLSGATFVLFVSCVVLFATRKKSKKKKNHKKNDQKINEISIEDNPKED